MFSIGLLTMLLMSLMKILGRAEIMDMVVKIYVNVCL